jgi:hypothetical protein|tara:strand:+ start:332 stop:1150 length:819 start_codon:yes stop_codon:yes gene_type:complete
MATYKSDAGAILQPGNQINKLSSFNHEGVFGWPGIEAFELVGYVKVSNLAATKASFKSFDITVPSPDRRVSDRVRDDRTSLIVKASSGRPAYVYGASISIAQDDPSSGLPSFPASPITADIGGTNTEVILLGPDNGGSPFGVPATQANGLAGASSSLTFSGTTIAQGTGATTTAGIPFWTTVTTAGIDDQDAANSMMFKVTSDTTFKVYNVNAITGTAVNGDGLFISSDDSDAGRAAYIVCRVNYLRPAADVAWSDVSSFVDFASQVGGTDS